MTTVYHELLPQSCLLLLLPNAAPAGEGPEPALEQGLHCASCSGKAAVWVDCELVPELSPAALRILHDYRARLLELPMTLVLVHASAAVQQALCARSAAADWCFAPTLWDAAWLSDRGRAAALRAAWYAAS